MLVVGPSRASFAMSGDGDEEKLREEFTTILEAARNGAKLMVALVTVLVTYFVSVLQVKSVEEVDFEDADELEDAAKEGWQEQLKGALPSVHAARLRKWAGEVKMKPTKETPLGGSTAVGSIVEGDLRKAARSEVADMDLTPVEKEKAVKDMTAQGLTCARIINLSLSITLGKVFKSGADVGMKYGGDPAHAQPVKDARKAKSKMLSTIISGKNFVEAASYFSNLMQRYAADSLIEEAALLGSWWAETAGCFAADKELLFDYLEAYFEKYMGRGLPTVIDTALVIRLRGGVSSAGVSKDDFKKLTNRVSELETQVASHKKKIVDLEEKVKKTKLSKEEQDARRAKVVCNNCGKKGHYASECPEKEAE